MSEMNISYVIIGKDVEKTIRACIASILACKEKDDEIIYVDGKSQDATLDIVKKFKEEITVLIYPHKRSNQAKQRNYGWKKAKNKFIFFIDGDCTVNDEFIRSAKKEMNTSKDKIICGMRREKKRRSFFSLISDIEWEKDIGEIKYFGGEFLIRKEALEKVKGYDESLIAGEDYELSSRLRSEGYIIQRLHLVSSWHNTHIDSFLKYFKRCLRTGRGYEKVGNILSLRGELHWKMKKRRILLKGLLMIFLLSGMLFFPLTGILLLLLIVHPLHKIFVFKRKERLTWNESFLYAMHLSCCFFPMLLGIVYAMIKDQ